MSVDASVQNLPVPFRRALDRTVEHLKSNLGENLHSLILYGSLVRGGIDLSNSDINLLIVLEVSTPDAHERISEGISGRVRVDPMIIEHDAIARAMRVFALKFLSIRRNYVVLHGADPLKDLQVDPNLLVLLSEQELRNIRMRLVHAYIVAGHRFKRYLHFLIRNSARIIICLSNAVRYGGIELPREWPARLSIIGETLRADVSVLDELLNHKTDIVKLDRRGTHDLHAHLINLLQHAIAWMEQQWPALPL